jgi:hypothetical protein
MGIGFELPLTPESNNFVPGVVNTWANVDVGSVFSDPSDIGIVLLRAINVYTTASTLGVRHPQETSYSSYSNISGLSQTLLACGAQYISSSSPCTIQIRRSGSQASYKIRVIAGIKRDSCELITYNSSQPYSFTTSGIQGWYDLNIYDSNYPPPSGVEMAIVEARATGYQLGFRSLYDSSSLPAGVCGNYTHYLVPVRLISSNDIRCRINDGGYSQTLYVRGWIKRTNPGFYALRNAVQIYAGTSPSAVPITQQGYTASGALVSVNGVYNTSYTFHCQSTEPASADVKDNYALNRHTHCVAKCNSSEEIETYISSTSGQFTFYLIGIAGSYEEQPPPPPPSGGTSVIGQYRKGKLSITHGSNMVTGIGTTWLDDGITQGNWLKISGYPGFYYIYNVVSNTLIELRENFYSYDGGNVYSRDYGIVRDFTQNQGYPLFKDNDIGWHEIITHAFHSADFELYDGRRKYVTFEPQASGSYIPVWNETTYQPNTEMIAKAKPGIVFFDRGRSTLLVCLGTATSAYPVCGIGKPIWLQEWGRVIIGSVPSG